VNGQFNARFVGRRLAPVLLLAACFGCAPQSDDAPAHLDNELLARSLMATWESADTDAMLDLFWPDATYDDFPNQVTYQGIDEIVAYLTGVHAWGDDVFMNVGRVHAGPDGATAEWVFSALQNRPLGSMMTEGTGREVVLNGVTILEIEGGRIRRAADYSDVVPMLLQLGVEIALPSGDTLSMDDAGN